MPDITLTLNENEQQILLAEGGILDSAAEKMKLKGSLPIAQLLQKIGQAQQEAAQAAQIAAKNAELNAASAA